MYAYSPNLIELLQPSLFIVSLLSAKMLFSMITVDNNKNIYIIYFICYFFMVKYFIMMFDCLTILSCYSSFLRYTLFLNKCMASLNRHQTDIVWQEASTVSVLCPERCSFYHPSTQAEGRWHRSHCYYTTAS